MCVRRTTRSGLSATREPAGAAAAGDRGRSTQKRTALTASDPPIARAQPYRFGLAADLGTTTFAATGGGVGTGGATVTTGVGAGTGGGGGGATAGAGPLGARGRSGAAETQRSEEGDGGDSGAAS